MKNIFFKVRTFVLAHKTWSTLGLLQTRHRWNVKKDKKIKYPIMIDTKTFLETPEEWFKT